MEDNLLVCRAVKLGFLHREEVPEKVAEAILLDEISFYFERFLYARNGYYHEKNYHWCYGRRKCFR